MNNIYRKLTPNEVERAFAVKSNRSNSQKAAYWLLPDSMKRSVERDPAVAFADCQAVFFPDLFFREEKILIEIDGKYHIKRHWLDAYRDMVFAEHGFTTIRIKNEDTNVNVAFWQRVLEGLIKINSNRPRVCLYIAELQQMIEKEILSWTNI